MQYLDRISDLVSRIVYVFSAIWMGSLSLLIVGDVIGRGAFNSPILGTPEIVANSVVIITFLQLGQTVRIEAMLRADFLEFAMSPRFAAVARLLGYLLGAVLFGALAYVSVPAAIKAYLGGEYFGEGSFEISTVPIHVAMVFGCTLASANFVLLVAKSIVGPTLPADDIPAQNQ